MKRHEVSSDAPSVGQSVTMPRHAQDAEDGMESETLDQERVEPGRQERTPNGNREAPIGLFREEALSASFSARSDGAALMPALPLRPIVWAAVAMMLAFVLLLVFGRYGRSVQVVGALQPEGGQIQVKAPIAGVVTELKVADGVTVTRNQPIATVESTAFSRAGDETHSATRASLERKAERIDDAIDSERFAVRDASRTAATRLALVRSEIGQVENEIRLLDARGGPAENTVQACLERKEKGIVSDLAVAPHKDRELEIRANRASLQRTLASLQQDEASLLQAVRDDEQRAQQQVSELRRQLDDIEIEKIRLAGQTSRVLIASAAGRVLRVTAREGQTVENGDLVALIGTRSDRYIARFLVPSQSLAEVSVGQPAGLSVTGYAREKYGVLAGRVASISPAGVPSSQLQAPDSESIGGPQERQLLFEVDIAIDENEFATKGIPLRAGTRVEARIQLKRRPLYRWLIAPFTEHLSDPLPDESRLPSRNQ
ncbi:MAG: HlyD family efflux transporter periplasmic adaptor subunit [Lysobacteraceae bacterium]|nr:MAG: HlyD family efflux transporter periplasmic adaptor subunit [Xanthomonadaceae bacterium]